LNSEGDSVWYRQYHLLNGGSSLNYLSDIIQVSDMGYLACGYISPISPDTGIQSAWVIKLDSIGCDSAGCDTTVGVIEYGGIEAWEHGRMEVWPNPAREQLHGRLNMDARPTEGLQSFGRDGRFNRDLTLVIYDVFGREVQKIKIPDGQEEFQINIEGYPPGVYIAILENGFDFVESRKFIISGPHR
jgi:hypothetical protein